MFIRSCTWIVLTAAMITMAGCKKDYEALNKDPDTSTDIDPNHQLSLCQLQTTGFRDVTLPILEFLSPMIQQHAGSWGSQFGGLYKQYDFDSNRMFSNMYPHMIKNLVDIVTRTSGDPAKVNINAVARIYKVYLFSKLTDTYGDIPYFEAGKGYINGTDRPAYDRQEDIYKDFFRELDAAVKALDISKDKLTGDIIYHGNITQWQKFGNSLRLRLAMRVIKADPAMAKAEATAAINGAGGLILSAEDNAITKHMNIHNGYNWEFRGNGLSAGIVGEGERPDICIASTLWDHLAQTHDPRQFILGRAYLNDSRQQPFGRTDITELLKKSDLGFAPVKPGNFWWDDWPGGFALPDEPIYTHVEDRWLDSERRPQIANALITFDAPGIHITNAEVELLLAEASLRWNINGSAEQHYRNGVDAAIRSLTLYPAVTAVPQDSVNKYIAENPLGAGEAALQHINEQLWVYYFMDGVQAFANWRRSGYPKLESVSDPSRGSESPSIPRRLPYPIFESIDNKENYNAAVQRLGGKDDWTKPVWWDKL